ncbi:hypothetical protein DC366_12375 [Pelagivirga sediminicola]|uniref:DUF3566 domain-containing protein n=1 Tax=Pelagivirga sediminicola TaxID=2170575 RepID=A0A2T7G655_9RHOB|nr:hypothetical protein [Pelagivirga sediminicola]PVA09898.1 hypothetical protein DC366_12375 [Pelagivirga sediminicola]
MRDFFIQSLEKLIGIIIVLMGIGVIIGFLGITFGGGYGPYGQSGGLISGLLFLIGGAIYVILMGGFMYLGVGIYQNTLRTAKAMEKMTAGQ